MKIENSTFDFHGKIILNSIKTAFYHFPFFYIDEGGIQGHRFKKKVLNSPISVLSISTYFSKIYRQLGVSMPKSPRQSTESHRAEAFHNQHFGLPLVVVVEAQEFDHQTIDGIGKLHFFSFRANIRAGIIGK